jgi:hypothetical protein
MQDLPDEEVSVESLTKQILQLKKKLKKKKKTLGLKREVLLGATTATPSERKSLEEEIDRMERVVDGIKVQIEVAVASLVSVKANLPETTKGSGNDTITSPKKKTTLKETKTKTTTAKAKVTSADEEVSVESLTEQIRLMNKKLDKKKLTLLYKAEGLRKAIATATAFELKSLEEESERVEGVVNGMKVNIADAVARLARVKANLPETTKGSDKDSVASATTSLLSNVQAKIERIQGELIRLETSLDMHLDTLAKGANADASQDWLDSRREEIRDLGEKVAVHRNELNDQMMLKIALQLGDPSTTSSQKKTNKKKANKNDKTKKDEKASSAERRKHRQKVQTKTTEFFDNFGPVLRQKPIDLSLTDTESSLLSKQIAASAKISQLFKFENFLYGLQLFFLNSSGKFSRDSSFAIGLDQATKKEASDALVDDFALVASHFCSRSAVKYVAFTNTCVLHALRAFPLRHASLGVLLELAQAVKVDSAAATKHKGLAGFRNKKDSSETKMSNEAASSSSGGKVAIDMNLDTMQTLVKLFKSVHALITFIAATKADNLGQPLALEAKGFLPLQSNEASGQVANTVDFDSLFIADDSLSKKAIAMFPFDKTGQQKPGDVPTALSGIRSNAIRALLNPTGVRGSLAEIDLTRLKKLLVDFNISGEEGLFFTLAINITWAYRISRPRTTKENKRVTAPFFNVVLTSTIPSMFLYGSTLHAASGGGSSSSLSSSSSPVGSTRYRSQITLLDSLRRVFTFPTVGIQTQTKSVTSKVTGEARVMFSNLPMFYPWGNIEFPLSYPVRKESAAIVKKANPNKKGKAEAAVKSLGGHSLSKFNRRFVDPRLYADKIGGFVGQGVRDSVPIRLTANAIMSLSIAHLVTAPEEGFDELLHMFYMDKASKKRVPILVRLPVATGHTLIGMKVSVHDSEVRSVMDTKVGMLLGQNASSVVLAFPMLLGDTFERTVPLPGLDQTPQFLTYVSAKDLYSPGALQNPLQIPKAKDTLQVMQYPTALSLLTEHFENGQPVAMFSDLLGLLMARYLVGFLPTPLHRIFRVGNQWLATGHHLVSPQQATSFPKLNDLLVGSQQAELDKLARVGQLARAKHFIAKRVLGDMKRSNTGIATRAGVLDIVMQLYSESLV